MSEFKSEVLPSGIEFREDNNVYFIVDGGDEINITRLDIARMYGIAHPTKRRTGECCNVQSETTPDQVTNVPDINVGDIPQTVNGDKYETEVLRIAEILAISNYRETATAFLPENTWESLDDYGREISISAQIVSARAMVVEMYKTYQYGHVEGMLHEQEGGHPCYEKAAQHGLIPAPKASIHQPDLQVEPAEVILNLLLNNPSINLGDLIYTVRDNEGRGWDGPDVKSWGEAVEKAKYLLNKYHHINPSSNEQK